MIQTITRLPEMPLKDDQEAENCIPVKNDDIHENDVLMGRGGKNNRHIGNEKLRDIARAHVEKYKLSTKKIKSAISRDIVKEVRSLNPPGRFLRRVQETGEWEDVGDYLAREKVAQVLRDAVCEAAEATPPSMNPSMYPVPPFLHYPDARAGVFRPIPGMQHMVMDDESRRSALPGVVTASRSRSFGHPPGYHHMVPPWHPYGPPHSHAPYHSVHHPHQHPFPPGYNPPHPGPFAPSAAYATAYLPALGPRTHPSARIEPLEEMAITPAQQPLTASQGTSATEPAAYSFSASADVGGPPGTEPHVWRPPAYATPVEGTRKRACSLPPDSPEEKEALPSKRSSPASKVTSTKKTTATQTPMFVMDYDPTVLCSAAPTPRGAQARPTVWDHASQSSVAFAGSPHTSPDSRYAGQESLPYYVHPQPAYPTQPQPPARSRSDPLPPAQTAIALQENETAGTLIEPFQHVGFSSRKIPKSMARPTGNIDQFESFQQPGGSGTMEPLPVQQQDNSPELLDAAPNERSGRFSSRHNGRPNCAGGGAEVTHGLEWFQGELLLESDEDTEEKDEADSVNDSYPL